MSEEKRKNSASNQTGAYILIGIGVLLLLVNVLNISFVRLWPLLLIILGGYLLMGRNSIGSTAQTGFFSAPLDDATGADVDLHLSVGEAVIDTLKDSQNLIEADLTYVGDIDFDVSGAEHKRVLLRQTSDSVWHWINPANWFGATEPYEWQIKLTPTLPLNLNIHGGVGQAKMDLSTLKLRDLRLHGGAGRIVASLPASETGYAARIDGGVGEVQLSIPADTSMTMDIQGGVGQITVNIPDDTALRIKAHGGIGDVSVPARVKRVSGGSSDFELGKSGVWESEGFENAGQQITLNYRGGVGQLSIR